MAQELLPPGGTDRTATVWEAWTPADVSRRLAGLDGVPWYVAGGWAADLFLGGRPREHEDLEIAVPSGQFPAVRAVFAGYRFEAIGDGHGWPIEDPAFARTYQTWLSEPDTGVYRLDVFREPHDGETWIYRPDTRIRMPYERLVRHTAEGIPYLRPDVVLLFKAARTRRKDDLDFARLLPRLDPGQREWLREALALVAPEHPWRSVLLPQ